MKLTFLGAGEAFHERQLNISMILQSDTNVMLDCGYNVLQSFWRRYPDKDFLDAVFVSHFHAEHVGGLPMLIMRMRQEKRTKPLTIIGPAGFKKSFLEFYELMYRGFFKVTGFDVKIIEAKGGDVLELPGLRLSFADANHLVNTDYFVPTLAVKVQSDTGALCYSSDTVYTDRIAELAKGCDILVHDSYMPADAEYHKRMPAHSSPRDSARTAAKAGVKKLLLFNIHRSYENRPEIMILEARNEFNGDVQIPKEGQSFEI